MNNDKSFIKSLGGVALGTGLLLLLPLVAMQFTEEVVWSAGDFIIAGAMLFGTGFMYAFVTRNAGNLTYKVAVGIALLSGLFLLWSNLAVGLVGSEDNPFNVAYFLVLAVAAIGALIARFEPRGMANALFAAALAQALVGAAALVTGQHHSPVSSFTEILNVNGFFIVLFVIAALFFRYADQKGSTHVLSSDES